MKENLTQIEALNYNYFLTDINQVINDHGTEEFYEVKKWWSKSGLNVTVTEKEMVNEIVETISKHLSKGLFQLTIEEIIKEKECKDAIKRKEKNQTIVMNLNRKLSPFKIYIEFIVKSGIMEIKRLRYDFKVEPKVEIQDIKINIQQNRFKSFSFGPFAASITLYLLKGNSAMKIGKVEKNLNLPELITI